MPYNNTFSKCLMPNSETNRKEPNKINFCTWDIETDYPEFKDDVIAIGFYDGNTYSKFLKSDYETKISNRNLMNRFITKTLEAKYTNYIHYAHYGGKFDFLPMLDELDLMGYDYEIIDVNGRILQVIAYRNEEDKNNGKFITFRDSYAIMPQKLSIITHSFNVEHKKQTETNWFNTNEKDYTSKWKNHNELKNEFLEYLEYDVIGLYESIGYFQNIINSYGGEIKLTVASTSMDTFKHSYLKNKLHSINCEFEFKNKTIHNCETDIRLAYFGGRTEIFRRYGRKLKYYDVNSLYPYCMLQDMPMSKPFYVTDSEISGNETGFVYCNVAFNNENIIPLVPLKFNINGTNKLIYPLGRFKTWLDMDMVRKALEIGYDIEILEGYIFDTSDIFKDFILDFYELRSKNESLKLISKLIMNSSYGKFAESREKQQLIKYSGIDENILSELEPYLEDRNIYLKDSESRSKHIIPSISAHITNLAQLKLYEYMEKCKPENVYYCDTDSVITSSLLETGKRLGEMKQEYTIDEGIFLLPKSYCLVGEDDKGKKYTNEKPLIKLKGFTNTNYKFNDFYKAMKNNDYSALKYQDNAVFGFKESIKRFNKYFHNDIKTHELRGKYDKRTVLEDNILTKPLRIEDNKIVNY